VRALFAILCIVGAIGVSVATVALVGLGLAPQDSGVPAAGVPVEAALTGAIAVLLFVAGGALLAELRSERNGSRSR
jgi:hypothetical protein